MRRSRLGLLSGVTLLLLAPIASGDHPGPGRTQVDVESHSRWFRQVSYQPKEPARNRASLLGAWSRPQYVGMQAVHAVLVPDEPDAEGRPRGSKVLIVTGSSNRDPLGVILGGISGGIDNRPFSVINNAGIWKPDPRHADGYLFKRIEPTPYARKDYPVRGATIPGGKRSPQNSKDPPTNNSEIDLFCGGHAHLPNGNVLFAGGTKTYEDDFRGARLAWIYDWRTDRFVNLRDIRNAGTFGFLEGDYQVQPLFDPLEPGQTARFEAEAQGMRDGRWYPTLVQLTRGNIAIIGGRLHDDYNVSSTKIEVYNWRSNEVLSADFTPGPDGDLGGLYRKESPRDWGLYPRAHLMPSGDIFLSGDDSGLGDRSSKQSYWLSLNIADHRLQLSFRKGPERKEVIRYYPAVIHDPRYSPGAVESPRSEGLLHVGGQIGLSALENGPESDRYVDGKRVAGVKTSMSYFDYNPASPHGGEYHLFENWLGEEKKRPTTYRNPNDPELLDDSRINHLAVVLPTRQILVIGGGNYGYRLPVMHPQLFTPVPRSKEDPSGWVGTRMNPHQMPRLYHTTALLLPDGRVWVGGGNAYRAQGVRSPTGEKIGQVERLLRGEEMSRRERSKIRGYAPLLRKDTFPTLPLQLRLLTDPRYDYVGNQVALYDLDTAKYLPDSLILAEQHHVEAFSPPYMFQEGGRPKITSAPEVVGYDQLFRITVANAGEGGVDGFEVNLVKPGSVTHGMDKGQRLIPLRVLSREGDTFTVRAPQAPQDDATIVRRFYNHTPGYYMLFFIDKTKGQAEPVWLSAGVPSAALWVRLQADGGRE